MQERLMAAMFVLLAAGSASAGTVTVVNVADSGAGSLRDVVAAANPGDTVVFDASIAGKTITLTGGQITIAKNLVIDGGANRITVSGSSASRVFEIDAPAIVSISFLTIRDGLSTSVGGGCVRNAAGNLTLAKSTVTGCTSA